jgi:hypothetical protein
MPRHKKGTLVRIRTEEEVGEYLWDQHDTKREVKLHGWLYSVVRFLPYNHADSEYAENAYECKSLSTGALAQLFCKEITTRKPKGD